MTACPEPTRLTAAASGEDLGAERHAADCQRCRRTLDAELALRALAARLPRPPLAPDRRLALEASLLASVDSEERLAHAPRQRWRGVALAGALVAALVLITVQVHQMLTSSAARAPQAGLPPRPSVPAPPVAVVAPTVVPPAPSSESTIVAQGRAHFERRAAADRDVVVVRDGALAIDATAATRPLELTSGPSGRTIVRAEGARIEVRASRGTIHSVHVFAGSVEVVSGRKTVIVTAGATWEMPAIPAAAARSTMGTSPPVAPGPRAAAPHPARAFAAGWAALRANQPAAAVTAFQSAVADPDVGEDAGYWLAIAHTRAGDLGSAIDAFEAFVAAYPASPHAGAAHLALVRLLGATDPDRAELHRERATLDTDPRVREAATPGNPGLR